MERVQIERRRAVQVGHSGRQREDHQADVQHASQRGSARRPPMLLSLHEAESKRRFVRSLVSFVSFMIMKI